MQKRHAYLIIAHHEAEMLQCLISALDDKRNDIFVHFDKKWTTPPTLSASCSKVFICPRRIDVRWGGSSQIETELALIEFARSKGEYSYYHLLSGVDFPLKSQDYIHDFFNRNCGKEFIGYVSAPEETYKNRICKFHLFSSYFREANKLKFQTFRALRFLLGRPLNMIVKRKCEYATVKHGSNWFSITNELCDFILERKSFISKRYLHTRCADEIFLQTEVWNSRFRDKLYCVEDEFKGCMRKIDWTRGTPYTWQISDIEELSSSDRLFARKICSVELSRMLLSTFN